MKINPLIIFEILVLSLLPVLVSLISTLGNGVNIINIGGESFRSLPLLEAVVFFGFIGFICQFHGRVRSIQLILLISLCCLLSAALVFSVNWLLRHDIVSGYLEAGLIILNASSAVLTWMTIKIFTDYLKRKKVF